MTAIWERVEPGVYATAWNGHVLQVRRNPDRDASRPYISIVDAKPVGRPSYNLQGAKSLAMHIAGGTSRQQKPKGAPVPGWAQELDKGPHEEQRQSRAAASAQAVRQALEHGHHANGAIAEAMRDAVERQEPPELVPELVPEPVHRVPVGSFANGTKVANLDQVLDDIDNFYGVFDIDTGPPDSIIEPQPAPEPVQHKEPPVGNRIVITLRGEIGAVDTIAVLTQIQAAVQLLQELGSIDCKLDLPDGITL